MQHSLTALQGRPASPLHHQPEDKILSIGADARYLYRSSRTFVSSLHTLCCIPKNALTNLREESLFPFRDDGRINHPEIISHNLSLRVPRMKECSVASNNGAYIKIGLIVFISPLPSVLVVTVLFHLVLSRRVELGVCSEP